MSGDIDKADDEAFFARWSRKKQQAKPVVLQREAPAEVAAPAQPIEAGVAVEPNPTTDVAPEPTEQIAKKPLTEDDFKVATHLAGIIKSLRAAVKALCYRDSNLLTAGAILKFAFEDFREIGSRF